MSLEAAIADWDGKSATDIAAVFAAYGDATDFPDTIIDCLSVDELQKGASWLLKAWLERANRLGTASCRKVYRCLPAMQHWESRLHLLQCIPFMPIGSAERKILEKFLRQALTDSNKLVRAWSYNGFYELARQYPEYRDEAEQFFAMAMRDEAASVRARIRNIMQQGFNDK